MVVPLLRTLVTTDSVTVFPPDVDDVLLEDDDNEDDDLLAPGNMLRNSSWNSGPKSVLNKLPNLLPPSPPPPLAAAPAWPPPLLDDVVEDVDTRRLLNMSE